MQGVASAVERVLRESAGRGDHTRVAGVSRAGSRTVGRVAPTSAGDASERDLFEIGSVTKVFTGTLLAEMVIGGEVDLADPLSRHLPASHTTAWPERSPTLEELATHRADLPNTPKPLAGRELRAGLGLVRGDPWAGVSEEDYRRMLRETRPSRPPGGRMGYSSAGFGLLGDALAARAGTSYGELLRRRVCLPLGLRDTGVEVDPSRLAAGHSRRGAPRPPLRDFMPGAGSLRSSAGDMLTFLEACLSPPGDRLGEALALALQPRARINRRMSIGLGWLISSGAGSRQSSGTTAAPGASGASPPSSPTTG